MPVCTKCGVPKRPDEFYERRPGVRRRDCISCHAARQQRNHQRNKPHNLRRVARWRANNPDKARRYARTYQSRVYWEDPEKFRNIARDRARRLTDDYVNSQRHPHENLDQARRRLRAIRAARIFRRWQTGARLRD